MHLFEVCFLASAVTTKMLVKCNMRDAYLKKNVRSVEILMHQTVIRALNSLDNGKPDESTPCLRSIKLLQK